MRPDRIKIEGGRGFSDTKVYDQSGVEQMSVKKVMWEHEVGGLPSATVTFLQPDLTTQEMHYVGAEDWRSLQVSITELHGLLAEALYQLEDYTERPASIELAAKIRAVIPWVREEVP